MRLQCAILGEIFTNFLLAVLVLGSVSVGGVVVQSTSRFSEVPLGVLLAGIPFVLVGLLPHLLPVSLLTAVLLTYGRMSAEGEIAALRASGVHLFRALAPAFALAFAIAALNQHVLGEAIPRLYLERGPYLRRVAAGALEGRASVLSFPNFYLEGAPTGEPGVRRNVVLFLRQVRSDEEGPAAERKVRIATASRAHTRIDRARDELVVALHDPRFLDTQAGGEASTTAQILGDLTLQVPLDEIVESGREIVKERDMPSPELWAALARGTAKRPAKATFELGRRAALAAAPIVFAMLGAPLGILLRRGNRLFAFSVAFGVVLLGYYPLLVLGETLFETAVRRDSTPPHWPWLAAVGAGVGDTVLGLLGVGLLRRLFRM